MLEIISVFCAIFWKHYYNSPTRVYAYLRGYSYLENYVRLTLRSKRTTTPAAATTTADRRHADDDDGKFREDIILPTPRTTVTGVVTRWLRQPKTTTTTAVTPPRAPTHRTCQSMFISWLLNGREEWTGDRTKRRRITTTTTRRGG